MSTSTIKELGKQTVEIHILIPWEEIKNTYEKVLTELAKQTEIPGFRKGKAPKNLLKQKLDKAKIYEEVIKEIVPQAYTQALQQHNLKPVSSPKIEVLSAKEKEDWKIKVVIALKPKIKLKNYKEKIQEIKKGKTKIWTPGQEQKKDEKEKSKPTLEEIIDALLSETEIEISDILVEEETNRLLSNLLDQTQKLGLTVEQYLISKGKTREQLRQEYAQQAFKNLALEFTLQEIAEQENIIVTPEDIENLIQKVEKDEEKEKLRKESYYLAHLLRQQKTLEFLSNL